MHYLYGISGMTSETDFGAIGFSLADDGKGNVRAHRVGNLCALVGPSPVDRLEGLERAVLVPLLLSHQQTIEILMKEQFVLPCKFGSLVKDDAEVRALLSSQQTVLDQHLNRMRTFVEYGVVATWDVNCALQEIAKVDPEVARQKDKCLSANAENQNAEKVALGQLLATKLKLRAENYSEQVISRLKENTQCLVAHDTMNDSMLLNVSVLVGQNNEKSFYSVLYHFDERWDKKIAFRCIGPLPPYSFCTVMLVRFDRDVVEQARKTLGLQEGAMSCDDIKLAYRKLVMTVHPDANPEMDKERFEGVNSAYKMLLSYHMGHCLESTLVVSTQGVRPDDA